MSYLKNVATNAPAGATPQREPLLGTAQMPNSAGGYAWAVDDWTRLDRFLVLGSEGGSYYATERALTAENASAVLRCIAADGPRAVRRIVEISEAGRAPKNDPAIFALALARQPRRCRRPSRRAGGAAARLPHRHAPLPLRAVRRAVPGLGARPARRRRGMVHRHVRAGPRLSGGQVPPAGRLEPPRPAAPRPPEAGRRAARRPLPLDDAGLAGRRR